METGIFKGKEVLSYLMIVLSALILALNYHIFIVPNNFAPAGLNGIATMVQYKVGFSIGYMSLLINIPLCFLA
ncbi:MAG: YitT family protein, partial [Clostridia bacterium]|nr:YitT family protein [Clostridia bacterium]